MNALRSSATRDLTTVEGGRRSADLLARLKNVARCGTGWTARCPAHDDNRNSLSIHHRNGRWLLYCHAGCRWAAIIDAIGVRPAELFDDEREQGV